MGRVRAILLGAVVPALLVAGFSAPVGAEPDGPRPETPPEPTIAQALFNQCPDVGSNLGCALLIVINADGTVTVQDSGQGPYDGDDDTLVGVQNNANITITKLTLTGASTLLQPPFDFEGDGLCDWAGGPAAIPAGCPFGPTGYEGPGTSFSNISVDLYTGDVNFSPGIGPGGSAYFSLESAITASDLSIPAFVIPVETTVRFTG
jgi:hypothetical protein